MSAFRYTAEQRAALRFAVTSSPLWKDHRKARNLSPASLDINTLEKIARAFGIDPAAYAMPPKATPTRLAKIASRVRRAYRALFAH